MSNDKDTQAIVLKREDAFSRALEPTTWDAAMECGKAIAKVGIGGVKTPEEAVIRIMAGREIGLGAMASLRLVYSINGKVGYDATLIRARALAHPECEYFEPVEITETEAVFRGKRKGQQKEQVVRFSIQDAQRANLAGKDVWKAYPKNMLAARATVNLARLLFPEAVAGMYTPDEIVGGYGGDPGTDPTPPGVIDAVIEDATVPAPPDFEALIAEAQTTDQLMDIAKQIEDAKKSGKLDAPTRKKLANAWAARSAALSQPNGQAATS